MTLNSYSDYLEVPLPYEPASDLWVKTVDDKIVPFKNVRSAVRYGGFWSIDHEITSNLRATAMFPSEKVLMLSLIYREDQEEDDSDEET